MIDHREELDTPTTTHPCPSADDWAQRVETHTRKANAYAGACCDELLAGNVEIALKLAVRCRHERVQLLIAIRDADE